MPKWQNLIEGNLALWKFNGDKMDSSWNRNLVPTPLGNEIYGSDSKFVCPPISIPIPVLFGKINAVNDSDSDSKF